MDVTEIAARTTLGLLLDRIPRRVVPVWGWAAVALAVWSWSVGVFHTGFPVFALIWGPAWALIMHWLAPTLFSLSRAEYEQAEDVARTGDPSGVKAVDRAAVKLLATRTAHRRADRVGVAVLVIGLVAGPVIAGLIRSPAWFAALVVIAPFLVRVRRGATRRALTPERLIALEEAVGVRAVSLPTLGEVTPLPPPSAPRPRPRTHAEEVRDLDRRVNAAVADRKRLIEELDRIRYRV